MLEINGGAGYYVNREKKTYELLIGGGWGYTQYRDERMKTYGYNFNLDAPTRNLYIQPNFAFKPKQHVVLAAFVKANWYHYSGYSTAYTPGTYYAPVASDGLFLDHRSVDALLMNPGLSVKGGWNELQFVVQASRTFNLLSPDLYTKPVCINIGFWFNPSFFHKNAH
jgi:hypothetical protein